jgi:iron complex outermembrane recepter protein
MQLWKSNFWWLAGTLSLLTLGQVASAAAPLGDRSTTLHSEHTETKVTRSLAESPLQRRIAQADTATIRVTRIDLNRGDGRLEIALETAEGKPLQVESDKFTTEGNSLIADIPNAVLSLQTAQTFRADSPTSEIASVIVTQIAPNRIQVRVTGKNAIPKSAVTLKTSGSIYSLNPVEDLEIQVTGSKRTPYRAPNATTATRTDTPLIDIPQSIQVIPQQVLKDQQVTRVGDAVRNVSGVTIGQGFGSSADGFIIRGFSAPNTLIDGFKGSPDTSSFSTIPETSTLERIEVLKGPASILYGNVQPGGIINLVRKKPLDKPTYNAEVSLGSFSSYQANVDLSGPLNTDKSVLYRLNGNYLNSASFRDFTQIDRVVITPQVSWKIGDRTTLNINSEYLKDRRPFDLGLIAFGTGVADIPISRRLGEPGDFRKVESIAIGSTLEHKFSDDWQIHNGIRFDKFNNQTSRFQYSSLDESTGELLRSYLGTTSVRNNYTIQTDLIGKFNTGSIGHQLLVGVDYANASEVGSGGFSDPGFPINIFNPSYGAIVPTNTNRFSNNDRNNNVGIYVQDQIAFSPQFKALIGGRVDLTNQSTDNGTTTSTQSDTAFSPRVGVVYQPTPEISLYTSLSTSFNPNLFTLTATNEFLKPERGTQYEVGIKGNLFNNRLSTTLAFFDINKTNLAVIDPSNTERSLAIGAAKSQGIELDISGEIVPGWNAIASYAYTDARVTQGDEFAPTGSRLLNSPKNTASLWTSYQLQSGDLKGLGAGIGVFYVGDRSGNSANTYFLPSYLRTDASIFYRKEDWSFSLGAKNLFGVRYIKSSLDRLFETEPGEPFTLMGTVSVKF